MRKKEEMKNKVTTRKRNETTNEGVTCHDNMNITICWSLVNWAGNKKAMKKTLPSHRVTEVIIS